MEIEISLSDIFGWLRKGAVLIIAMAILFGAIFFAYSKYVMEPVYSTSIKFSSSSVDQDSQLINYYITIAPQHIEYLNVPEFYQMVSEKILATTGEFCSERDVASSIAFSSVVEDTGVFFVSVNTNNPQKTYAIASAVASCAPAMIKSLKPDDLIIVVSSPYLPTAPSAPHILRNAVLGFFIGFFVTCILVVVKELMDTRLKSVSEITERYKLPVIGTVPDFSDSDRLKGGR